MSRSLLFTLLMLLSGRMMLADNHHHDKKDTVVIVESPKGHHHDHCEQTRSFKTLACQFTRNYVRETVAILGIAGVYYLNQGKSACLPAALGAGCIGFTAGHIIKKGTKLFMYLNNIPKR